MSRRSKRSPDLFDTTGSSGTSPETSGPNVEATQDELAHGKTDRIARVLKKIKDGGLRQRSLLAQIMVAAAKVEPGRARGRGTSQVAISLTVAVAARRRRVDEAAGNEGVAARVLIRVEWEILSSRRGGKLQEEARPLRNLHPCPWTWGVSLLSLLGFLRMAQARQNLRKSLF